MAAPATWSTFAPVNTRVKEVEGGEGASKRTGVERFIPHTPCAHASALALQSRPAPMATKEAKPAVATDLAAEEDHFEDFPADPAWGNGNEDEENRSLWVEDWDDQEVAGPDAQARLREQLDRSMKE